MTLYDANGKRKRFAFHCPQCRSENTRVVMTTESVDDASLVIRRRCCNDCSHRFFTAQEPEYLLRREQVKWSRNSVSFLP